MDHNKKKAPTAHTVEASLMVGVTGFEPATPCSRSKCATRLRYTPSDRPAAAKCLAGAAFMPKVDGAVKDADALPSDEVTHGQYAPHSQAEDPA